MSVNSNNGSILKVAAVQMDVNPAPTDERLRRAEKLVVGATEAGAQLVLLPECFNTGYIFNDDNHARVEKLHGMTASWLRDTAARLNIHLSGSFMMLDQGDTYNSLLLFAPDGRYWRYDKNYPWGWEQGYFRKSQLEPKITIANTDLGDIGMLICWDVSHTKLWEMYAGHIDLMLISSSPVDVGYANYKFPNGDNFTLQDLGSLAAASRNTVRLTFGDMMNQQAAWLGVPVIHSIEYDHILTDIPKGRRSLLGFASMAPWLLKYYSQANEFRMSCDLVHECKILQNNGEVKAKLAKDDGETFIVAEINLADSKPIPQGLQPKTLIPRMSYFIADVFLPMTVKSVYAKGKRMWSSG